MQQNSNKIHKTTKKEKGIPILANIVYNKKRKNRKEDEI